MPASLLSSRASFELAALTVTWVAVVLLVLVVANLHARLRRLEQRGAPASAPASVPYGRLVGTRVEDVVGAAAARARPRVVLFVSPACGSCARLLEELASPSWTVPSALVWTDGTPPPGQQPDGVTVIEDGPRISAALDIRVTPFGLVVDEAGHVVRAGPVSNLRSLVALNGSTGPHRQRVEQS